MAPGPLWDAQAMTSARIATLSLLAASISLYSSALVSGCGGSVAAGNDAGGGSGGGSGSSSGFSGSSSGVTTSSSSGGTSSSSSGISGSSSGSGGDLCANLPASACLQPPPAPTGTTSMPQATTHNYAMRHLYLGDTDRQGVTTSDAWKSFGYNIDGKVTTALSADVCALVAGSSRQVQVDGNGGIDNSFGANIMPIIETLDSTASQQANTQLQAGYWTQMTYVMGFDDTAGNTTSALGLTGVELAGAAYPGLSPAWDLTTNWPVAPVDIAGCTPTVGCPAGTDPVANALVKFPQAFQTHGTFVNGTPAPLTIPIALGGQQLALNIQSGIITFDPLMPGAVTNGVIAGVISTQDLIAALQKAAGSISTALCTGSAFQSIATQIEQGADILLSGTTVQNVPGQTCNAISIGLGFDATEIAPPTIIAPPAPQAPNPCGDGG